MAKKIRPRRGTTEANAGCTGGVGEITVDTTKHTLRVHDGTTAGGTELARTSDIPTKVSQLTNDSGYAKSSAVLPLNPGSIEMYPGSSAGYGGFIDFHYNSSTVDYTSRIIEYSSGQLTITASNGLLLNGVSVATTSNIPTKVSQLTNDSGYLTSHQSLASCLKTSGGTISGSLTVTGTLKGGTVQATSDGRLKEGFSNPTYDLSSLKAYRYRFKGQSVYHVGLIAQEVEKIIPEAVAEGEDGYLALDYNAVVAALVNAVNSLQAQINQLKEAKNG